MPDLSIERLEPTSRVPEPQGFQSAMGRCCGVEKSHLEESQGDNSHWVRPPVRLTLNRVAFGISSTR